MAYVLGRECTTQGLVPEISIQRHPYALGMLATCSSPGKEHLLKKVYLLGVATVMITPALPQSGSFQLVFIFPGQYYNPPCIYHLILAELVCSSHTLQGLDCSGVRHSLERAFFSHPTETATVCSKKRKSPMAERE